MMHDLEQVRGENNIDAILKHSNFYHYVSVDFVYGRIP